MDPPAADAPTLRAYAPGDAAIIRRWLISPADLDAWASIPDLAVDEDLFRRWHAQPGVHPYVLLDGAEPVGYGEVWVDAEEGEAELARIAIAPARRGRGLGRALTRLLTGEARRLGFRNIWLRVVPTNRNAISAYTAAGFTRATTEEERAFNAAQPRAYVWMRASEE